MKNRIFTIVLTLLMSFSLYGQEIVEVEKINEVPKTIAEILTGKVMKSSVDVFRVLYTTKDTDGEPTTASGVMCIPKDLQGNVAAVIYGHGTVPDRYSVPSRGSTEANLAAFMAAKGFVSVSADYLGLGDNPGLHPYVHAESEAWANIDLLIAAQDYLKDSNTPISRDVFVTGYSQGGHAAMATHRALEMDYSDDFNVLLSAPMSGPYSIYGIYDFFINQDPIYNFPGYLVWVVLSYQKVYGTLYDELSDVFIDEAVGPIEQYLSEDISLDELHGILNSILTEKYGANYVSRVIKEDVITAYRADENNPMAVASRDNDVYDWAPQATTRLLYCSSDDQVPFFNSVLAESTMQDNGAPDVMSINIDSTLNHGGCALPAIGMFLDMLDNYDITSTEDADIAAMHIYPNPTSRYLYLESENVEKIYIYDLMGAIRKTVLNSNQGIDISELPSGMYLLKGLTREGNLVESTERLIKI